MPETKQVLSTTTVNVVGNIITIHTFYDPDAGIDHIIQAFISEYVGSIDGTSFVEGELIFTFNNYPGDIDAFLTPDGDLILIANDPTNYAIDSNGDLIYTT